MLHQSFIKTCEVLGFHRSFRICVSAVIHQGYGFSFAMSVLL